MTSRQAFVLVFLTVFAIVSAEHTEVWNKFHDVVVSQGEWATGGDQTQRPGQSCDAETDTAGCVVLWLADPQDEFQVTSLPLNEQDGFQNTQHYDAAWNLHGHGILGGTLPRAPQDFEPVCYIANVSGSLVLAYEEGAGDALLPCPGTINSVPFTDAHLNGPNADLDDMCGQCYWSICTSRRSRYPQSCGGRKEGGVKVGYSKDNRDTVVELHEQVNAAYHCHLTMTDEEGACDYMQHQQHESDEGYKMDYGMMCGWEKVRYLNVSFCDCTKAAERHDRCSKNECLRMAEEGVVCGNCWGCNKGRSYNSIFVPPNTKNEYDGVCAQVRTAVTEVERNGSKMMCSKSLFCRDTDSWGSGCEFHCASYGVDSEVWVDPRCLEHESNSRRRLLHDASDDSPSSHDTPISWDDVHPDSPRIVASKFAQDRD